MLNKHVGNEVWVFVSKLPEPNIYRFTYCDYSTTQISSLEDIYTGKVLEEIVLYDIEAESFSIT